MTTVEQLGTGDASEARWREIRALLDEAFAGDFDDTDWEHALGGHHFVATEDGIVVAHAALVPRTLTVADRPIRTGYVEAVATAPARQRSGIGAHLMSDLATTLRDEFELGALATGRHSFYARLGWESWLGPTFVRDGTELTRTPDDDDSVMVLRFGPSATIDLTAPVACERRRGDAW